MEIIEYGFIIINVKKISDSTPIEGAMVTVISEKNEIISMEFTNSNGMTPKLMILLPKDESFDYKIKIDKVGYHSVHNIQMQVSKNITSMQIIELISMENVINRRKSCIK